MRIIGKFQFVLHQAGQEQEGGTNRASRSPSTRGSVPQGLRFPPARGQPQLLRVVRVSLMARHAFLIGLYHDIPRPISQMQKQRQGLGELAEVTWEPPGAEIIDAH